MVHPRTKKNLVIYVKFLLYKLFIYVKLIVVLDRYFLIHLSQLICYGFVCPFFSILYYSCSVRYHHLIDVIFHLVPSSPLKSAFDLLFIGVNSISTLYCSDFFIGCMIVLLYFFTMISFLFWLHYSSTDFCVCKFTQWLVF